MHSKLWRGRSSLASVTWKHHPPELQLWSHLRLPAPTGKVLGPQGPVLPLCLNLTMSLQTHSQGLVKWLGNLCYFLALLVSSGPLRRPPVLLSFLSENIKCDQDKNDLWAGKRGRWSLGQKLDVIKINTTEFLCYFSLGWLLNLSFSKSRLQSS